MSMPSMRPLDDAKLEGSGEIADLLGQISALRGELLEREALLEPLVSELPMENRASARNLVHYLSLRSHDLRPLQLRLARQGLSSLGRAESHALWNLNAVETLLRRLLHDTPSELCDRDRALSQDASEALLKGRSDALLGTPPADRSVRIMVTAPSDAATDYELVRDLLGSGMDCLRINCAHDGPDVWERTAAHLRKAELELGRSCRILMDLGGPRVRTGPLEAGPEVVKIRPERNVRGQVVRPASVWLTPTQAPEEPTTAVDVCLPVTADLLSRVEVGQRLLFEDLRGEARALSVVGVSGHSRWATLDRTAYVGTGTRMRLEGGPPPPREIAGAVGPLPAIEERLHLEEGDHLILTRDEVPGRLPRVDAGGRGLEPGRIACVPADALGGVRVGERVWFDEGKIGGVIRAVDGREVRVEITSAKPGGTSLRAEKGINLPDSTLDFPSLTARDLAHLPAIVNLADLVGYSFVRSADDIRTLQARLSELGRPGIGIVLKIETSRAFDQLPSLLLAAMRSPVAGVMIARGDLAVECGFARLAEVQEEILWLCEAAHAPVIWATQVLEQLAKTGRPSRAEVTDAAMAERAECVMLNKGPYVVDAVRALDSILRRMQTHQAKKRATLRELHIADLFFEATTTAVGEKQWAPPDRRSPASS